MAASAMVPNRRNIVLGLGATALFARQSHAQETPDFPPKPAWTPSFFPNLDEIVERVRHYGRNAHDFVVFQKTTCCLVPPGLSDTEAEKAAVEVLQKIISFHPDMNPQTMADGNILVGYNHPAYNVIPLDFARQHWREIEERHLDGLTRDEVLVTPLGPNVFDDVGKMALLGRSYMFMDALSATVVRIERAV
ncbi:MAG: hypothetical protein HKN27_01800 [Silicimonas sp.]|nr:hypothetical protein [Silicimonas sp.]